jgi:hypothetical protein
MRSPLFSPLGSHLLGHASGEHDAHDLVSEVGRWPEHQGAASVNNRDAVLPAVLRGGIRDAARATAPMHLDMLEVQLAWHKRGSKACATLVLQRNLVRLRAPPQSRPQDGPAAPFKARHEPEGALAMDEHGRETLMSVGRFGSCEGGKPKGDG